jgi:hypothetical protein
MLGVCGLDINEMLIRAVWARIPHFELIFSDNGIHRSWFSRSLQPLPAGMPADTYPGSGRLPALSRG